MGHGRAELAEAAASQMKQLAAYHTFDIFTNKPATELARYTRSLLQPLAQRNHTEMFRSIRPFRQGFCVKPRRQPSLCRSRVCPY